MKPVGLMSGFFRYFASAVSGSPGTPGAPAMRTLSPVAMPSGGLITTRSSATIPESDLDLVAQIARDRDLLENDAPVVADGRDMQSALD